MAERRTTFEDEWPAAKAELTGGNATAYSWKRAYERLLAARLNDRYLRPIESIKANGGFVGEGFAILTIQCALIEFLAALRLGWNYEHGAEEGVEFRYGDSQAIYVNFIRQAEPFDTIFDTKKRAKHFYSDVRCGLVHEAQTKNGWRVWASNSGTSADLQAAFIRKLDYIHEHSMRVMSEAKSS
jgi:hypothetical protein